MPISFPIDNSSQVGGNVTSGSIYYAVVNQCNLDITSNILKTYIDTKQNILTSATVLLGDGGSITNINWNNITQNKPTNFQCDFNSTLTNKPSVYPPDTTNIYTKTQTDSLLSGKESVLSFTAPLARATNTISIDLSAYDTISLRNTALIPYINYTALNSCNFITASVSTLTNYSTTTAMNSAISTALTGYDTIVLRNTALQPYINYTVLNSCNYITASVSTLTNYSTTTAMNSAITTALTGYDTIALRNTALIPYINYTALNSCNFITASVSTLTNYSTTTTLNSCNYISSTVASNTFLTSASLGTTYLKLDGTNSMSGNLGIGTIGSATSTLSLYTDAASTNTNLSIKANNSTRNATIVLFNNLNNAGVIGFGGSVAGTYYINNLTLTSFNDFHLFTNNSATPSFTVLANGNVGIGITNPAIKLDVNGTMNATTIQEGGVALTTKYQANISASALTTNTATRAYPPAYLTGGTTTFTTLSGYGNGVYVATAGSNFTTQELFYCMGGNPAVNGISQWTSGFGNFNTTGAYSGPVRTIINTVSTAGETATLQLPYLVVMTNYTLTSSATPYHNYMMKDWVFCGSTDGTNYTQLDSRIGINWTANQTTNYTFTNTTPYTYYRIVIKKTNNVAIDVNYSATVCRGMTFFGYEIKNGSSIGTVGIGTTDTNNAMLNVYGNTILNGSVGIGTTTTNSLLELYTTTQLQPRLILSGQEYYQPYSAVAGNLSSSGITFLCGVNRGNNRQLWIADSANLAQNTTNPVIRINNTGFIDCIATNGLTSLPLSIGNSAQTTINGNPIILTGGNVGIGTNNPLNKLDVRGTTNSEGLYVVDNASYGTNQFGLIISPPTSTGGALIQTIQQGYGYNQNLMLQRDGSGYVYIGGTTSTGLRIAGWDGNTLYNGVNPIGITALNNVYICTGTSLANYTTRFFVNTSGNIGIGTLTPSSILDVNGTLTLANGIWHNSKDGKQRIYFANNGITYFQGYNNGGVPQTNSYIFRNSAGTDIIGINDNGNTYFAGEIAAKFITISGSYRDLLGCSIDGTAVGASGNYNVYLVQGTFTGIHRVFTEDPLFIKEEPQQFKDDYEGRIVIANGKIATDTNEDKDVWEIKYDKDGITIEDALPIIELSRKKKDKRVFGVLGAPKRQTNRPERIIINSVGEGAIWICNSNGNFENGDFIESSSYLGYGERQDDDFFHNFTVGKITINCDFTLNSPLYQCIEIDDLDENGNKLRVAFVSCVYYCG